MKEILNEIEAERTRQKKIEGWIQAHDDKHRKKELAKAAAQYCYADEVLYIDRGHVSEMAGDPFPPQRREVQLWPWHADWWKPTSHRRNLIKAAALIVAEIERIDRKGNAARLKKKQDERNTRQTS